MTTKDKQQRLTTLREEYKTASRSRRREIRDEAAAPTIPCYRGETKERLPWYDAHFPFCSAACHEAHAAQQPTTPRKAKRQPTVQQMQQRLLEMAQAAAQTVIREGVSK